MRTTVLGTVVSVLTALGASQAYADGKPILIGLIAGTTGAYGSTGVAVVNGAQLAVDKINAAGGVLGRQLKLDAHNDNASATLSGQLFAKMVSDGAVVIAGSPDTGPSSRCATRSRPSAWSMTAASPSTRMARPARLIPGCSTSASTRSRGARRSANTR